MVDMPLNKTNFNEQPHKKCKYKCTVNAIP